MGWFTADPNKTVSAVGNALDKLFTSDEERAQAKNLLVKLEQQPQILTLEINKILARSTNVFVSGARPMILYTCGIGFLYSTFLSPLISQLFGYPMPHIDDAANRDLLYAILGLGGMRTTEKFKQVQS